MSTQANPRWDDDLTQFARLLCEIRATQDDLDLDALCESMDLVPGDVDELFNRADTAWETAKAQRWTMEIPAEVLMVGMRIVDERFAHVMDVGHVVIGPKWVTARAFHPETNIYPKTPYRIRRGDTVMVQSSTVTALMDDVRARTRDNPPDVDKTLDETRGGS